MTATLVHERAVVHTTTAVCRACAQAGLVDLHDFGALPLANALLPDTRGRAGDDDDERRVPLTLALCSACSLLQLRETVDPEVLFADYRYFSSYAASTLAYAEELAAALCSRLQLGPGHRVVEVASNDGYLLKNFVAAGIGVLGIEPARNIAEVASRNGIPTRCEFFGRDVGQRLAREGVRADCVLGNNVLAHVADLNGFVAGAAAMLKDRKSVV